MASTGGHRPEHRAGDPVNGPLGSPNVTEEEPPPTLAQYRKAAIVAGVGLLALLTDLATSYASNDGIDGGEWLHAMIVLVTTLLSTGGVATFSNTYSRGQLEAKLAAARTRR
jgi:hypothetical protein